MVHHVPSEKSKTVIFWLQHKLWCVYRPYKAKLPNSQAAGRGKRKDKDFRFSRLFLKALNFQRLIQRFFKEIVQKTGKNSHFLPPLSHGEIFKKLFVQPLHKAVFKSNCTVAILWSKMAFFTMAWRGVKVLPRP